MERQLPRNTTVALTYSFNRAVHMAQTVPINTPLPGSFNPSLPLSATNGVFPYGYSAGNIFEYESGGYMRPTDDDGQFQYPLQQQSFAVRQLRVELRQGLPIDARPIPTISRSIGAGRIWTAGTISSWSATLLAPGRIRVWRRS